MTMMISVNVVGDQQNNAHCDCFAELCLHLPRQILLDEKLDGETIVIILEDGL